MRIAIVGTGFVADFYLTTLKNHPQLELLGVMDRDPVRAERFARFYRLNRYDSLDEVLGDARVEAVVNLTNPSSHYEVSRAALLAGKHVYSEKPLSTSFEEARLLVELAESRGLSIAGAPCGLLGEAAQTMWKAIREGKLGKVRLAYAEIDGGPVHLETYRDWISESGSPWPYQDEFETGCTLEHAGYYLTWLCGFFGPARRVTSFAASLVPDKGVPLRVQTPDYSVGCIEFDDGVVARITCGIYAPHEQGLLVVGDGGVMSAEDCWDYGTPVRFHARTPLGIRGEKKPRLARLLGIGSRRVKLVRPVRFQWKSKGANPMDFARGIAEQAEALAQNRPNRISARFTLHVNEIVLALQDPVGMGSPRALTTTFERPEPMPWAR
jgi:predicted dehydrogenase